MYHTAAVSHNSHVSHTGQMDGQYVSLTYLPAAGMRGITELSKQLQKVHFA